MLGFLSGVVDFISRASVMVFLREWVGHFRFVAFLACSPDRCPSVTSVGLIDTDSGGEVVV
jgi:hypothetical protein